MPVKSSRAKKRKAEVEKENLNKDILDSAENKPSSKFTRKNLTIIIVALSILGLLYFFKGLFIAALINGQPISRMYLIQSLEKQGGKQMLNSLITETLIYQEAKKQNVNVGDSEINGEIKKLEDSFTKQGQSLDQALTLQGMTKNDLAQKIKIQKLVEKMIGKDIKVTDKEVSDYMEKNKSSIPEGESSSTIKEQLRQQKLNEKIQTWIDNLQKNAKIDYFVNY